MLCCVSVEDPRWISQARTLPQNGRNNAVCDGLRHKNRFDHKVEYLDNSHCKNCCFFRNDTKSVPAVASGRIVVGVQLSLCLSHGGSLTVARSVTKRSVSVEITKRDFTNANRSYSRGNRARTFTGSFFSAGAAVIR